MRGKLIDGITPLAAAISHSPSRTAMKPTPSQRLRHSPAKRCAGVAAATGTLPARAVGHAASVATMPSSANSCANSRAR